VELIFATKNYASKLSKSADIESNDPVQPTTKIMFTANIQPKQDSTAACQFTPELVEFVKGGAKAQSAIISNHGDSVLNIKMVNLPVKNLEIKNQNVSIKPGESKKLEFKWKSSFAENDSNISVTFEVKGDSAKRFTIPVIIKGTKPPEPKPTPTPIDKSKAVTAKPQPPPVQPIKKDSGQNQINNKWPVSDSLQPAPDSKK
jgi:hypothetical protein